MGQAAKYAVLAAAIAVVLVSAAAIINQLYPTEVVSNFGSSLTSALSVVGDFLTNVRGAFNYVLGSHLPLTISVALWLVVPFARLAFKVVVAVFRWINQ